MHDRATYLSAQAPTDSGIVKFQGGEIGFYLTLDDCQRAVKVLDSLLRGLSPTQDTINRFNEKGDINAIVSMGMIWGFNERLKALLSLNSLEGLNALP